MTASAALALLGSNRTARRMIVRHTMVDRNFLFIPLTLLLDLIRSVFFVIISQYLTQYKKLLLIEHILKVDCFLIGAM